MFQRKGLALTLLSFLSSQVAAGDVLALGDSDFSSTIKSSDLALVKFYAPWCGHCKKIAPEFEKAATILKQNDPPVVMIDVDCTIHQATCSEFGVSGYPTLKVFRSGEASEYNGGRTAGDMVKIMAGQAGPSSAEIKDTAKVEKLLNSKSNMVIGFFESDAADGANAFQKMANELREHGGVKFAHSYSADVAKAADQELGSVVLFRPKAMKSKFEEQVVKYSKDKFTVGLLRNWVKDSSKGLAPVIEPADMEKASFPLAIAMFNVDYERDAKGTQYWRNRVMKVGQNYKDMSFAVASKDSWGGFINEIGVTFTKAPIVVIMEDKQTKYLMTDEFDPKGEAFTKFLDSYKAGDLEKHLKSEENVDNEGKAKITLTAKNFDSYADGTKDVFIKFYAPWCGHCKTMAPKWDQLAENLKDNDSIIIADFDATANDVPAQFEVQGFPTLFWWGKGQAPQKYESGREIADFTKFIKEKSSDKSLRDEL